MPGEVVVVDQFATLEGAYVSIRTPGGDFTYATSTTFSQEPTASR